MALRNEHKDAFQEKYGVKLGFMSFFVKAAIDALKLVPAGQRRDPRQRHRLPQLLRHRHRRRRRQGAGRAGAAQRRADELRRDRAGDRRLGQRARENSLQLDELQGGTFTISNGGVYGSLLSTPIVNPPQSGILGLHAIQDRPVARDGQVVIRPMMYVALTYDHRIVDGREAVTFLKRDQGSRSKSRCGCWSRSDRRPQVERQQAKPQAELKPASIQRTDEMSLSLWSSSTSSSNDSIF